MLEAILHLAGFEQDDPVELLPEVGAFQASYVVGSEDRWRESVVAIYPHLVPPAEEAPHRARLAALLKIELELWGRAGQLLEAQREARPGRRPSGLQVTPLAVRPQVWRERVRPVSVDAAGWSWSGLVRPHVPWPSLADEALPEASIADALGRLVAALVVTPTSLGPVVPAEQLIRELAANDSGLSGTLRTHQLLVTEDAVGRLLVLPTQWRPFLVGARAAFRWSAP